MPIRIEMPRLSDTMQEGTLQKWRVKVGDKVSSGDILADVETDKATMELQSFDDGTVALCLAEEGQTLPVGSLILVLAEGGESVEEAAASAKAAGPAGAAKKKANAVRSDESSGAGESSTATAVAEPPPSTEAGSSSLPSTDRIRISPVARKIAEERGINPATLQGTGPAGRIIKRDVLTSPAQGGASPVAPARPAATKTARTLPPVKLEAKTHALTNMRKTIARRLVESKTTIPHFTVTVSVAADRLLDARESINTVLEGEGVKLSVNDLIVRATALALMRHPIVNSSWSSAGDAIQQHGTINIGIAVALPAEKGGGLVVPTLRDAHNMDLRQINSETKRLAKKARDTGLSIEEMSDGTFTISNLGMFGVDHFEAIINPPQAAILAVGAANEKPVVRDGKLTIGHEMTLTGSFDHRVVDGASAAEFLQTLRQLLENPAAMLV